MIYQNGIWLPMRRRRAPASPTWRDKGTPSIDRLLEAVPDGITINGINVKPSLVYVGSPDYATTSAWQPYSANGVSYGSALAIAGSGGNPTIDRYSPFLGSYDGRVNLGASGKYYIGSSNAVYDFTVQDLILESLFTTGPNVTNTSFICYKYTATAGYELFVSGGSVILDLRSASTTSRVTIGTVSANTLYHVICIADKSGSAIGYLNKTATSDIENISALGSFSNTAVFWIGASGVEISIHYLAILARENWLDTHLQPTLVDQRNALVRATKSKGKGTLYPVSASRASNAYCERLEAGSSTVKLYQVGNNHIRTMRDADGDWLIIEPQRDYICRYSDLFASWSKDVTGDSVDANNASHPSPISGGYMDGLIADATSSSVHDRIIASTANLVMGTRYIVKLCAKAGDKNFFYARFSHDSVSYGKILDLSTGGFSGADVGTLFGKWVRPLGNSILECSFGFVATANANGVLYIYFRPTASVTAWAGDGVTVNGWVAAAQLHAGDCPMSYVDVPSTATVSRLEDVLYWKGDDGNLGGVGSNKRVFFECTVKSIYAHTIAAAKTIWKITDGGSSSDQIAYGIDTSGYATITVDATGGTQRTATGPSTNILDGEPHTLFFECRPGKLAVCVDGVWGTPNTSILAADIPDDLDRIQPYGNGSVVYKKETPKIYSVRP